MLLVFAHVCELDAVVVVQTVNIVHHAGSFRPDGCQNQKVLQISVVSKVRIVQHDALKKLDQLRGNVSLNECLNSVCNFINVLGLRKSRLHDLINDFLTALVIGVQHSGPELC